MKTLLNKTSLFVALLFTLPACGPLFFVQADLPQVCETFTGQSFPGVPSSESGSFTYPPQTFDLGGLLSSLPKDRLTADIRVTSGTLTATGGVSDLGFINSLEIDLFQSADAGTTGLALLSYQKDDSAPAPTSIDLASGHEPNIFSYAEGGSITAGFSMSGTLPEQDWTADFKLCISADAKYQYL
jgi:hypothetical protein